MWCAVPASTRPSPVLKPKPWGHASTVSIEPFSSSDSGLFSSSTGWQKSKVQKQQFWSCRESKWCNWHWKNGFWWKTVQTAMAFTEVLFVHTVREGLCISNKFEVQFLSPQKAVPVARNLLWMLVTGRIGQGNWYLNWKVACASFGYPRILCEIFHFNRK